MACTAYAHRTTDGNCAKHPGGLKCSPRNDNDIAGVVVFARCTVTLNGHYTALLHITYSFRAKFYFWISRGKHRIQGDIKMDTKLCKSRTRKIEIETKWDEKSFGTVSHEPSSLNLFLFSLHFFSSPMPVAVADIYLALDTRSNVDWRKTKSLQWVLANENGLNRLLSRWSYEWQLAIVEKQIFRSNPVPNRWNWNHSHFDCTSDCCCCSNDDGGRGGAWCMGVMMRNCEELDSFVRRLEFVWLRQSLKRFDCTHDSRSVLFVVAKSMFDEWLVCTHTRRPWRLKLLTSFTMFALTIRSFRSCWWWWWLSIE